MNAELEAILNALLESRKILEAKLEAIDTRLDTVDTKLDAIDTRLDTVDTRLNAVDTRLNAVDTKLEAVAAGVAAIKEQIGDMNARDQYFMQKTGELETELFVLKQRQKA